MAVSGEKDLGEFVREADEGLGVVFADDLDDLVHHIEGAFGGRKCPGCVPKGRA